MLIEGTCTVNSEHTYKSGESPAIGDVIECVKGSYQSIGVGSVVKVVDLVSSSCVTKLKVEVITHVRGRISNSYYSGNIYSKGEKFPHAFKASAFKLKNSKEINVLAVSKTDKTKPSVKYIVLNSKGTMVGTADTDVILEDIVSKLLVKSPFDQYRVFTYTKVAKTPEIEVMWEDADE